MYKVKLTNLDEIPESNRIHKRYKIGDIMLISDLQFIKLRWNVQIIEHYKIIMVYKKRCKYCKNWVIKRKKIILN